MSHSTMSVSDAIILTGEEILARFSTPYRVAWAQNEEETQEWFITLQTVTQERNWYRETCLSAQAARVLAEVLAATTMHQPYRAPWWHLPGIKQKLAQRLAPAIAELAEKLYQKTCQEAGIPPDVESWQPPCRMSQRGYPSDFRMQRDWLARIGALIDQAALNPQQEFVVSLDLLPVYPKSATPS